MNIYKLIQEITPILEAYKLRPQYKNELDQARKINNHIDSKVAQLLINIK